MHFDARLAAGRGPNGALARWRPVVGDWDGDGTATPGLYNARTRTFHLRNANTSGPDDLTFAAGPSARRLVPLAGDWNGP